MGGFTYNVLLTDMVQERLQGHNQRYVLTLLRLFIFIQKATLRFFNNYSLRPRRVKQRVYPMLGFKQFDSAAVTISGIELAQKIKKGQLDTFESGLEGARVQELWQAVLAARTRTQ